MFWVVSFWRCWLVLGVGGCFDWFSSMLVFMVLPGVLVCWGCVLAGFGRFLGLAVFVVLSVLPVVFPQGFVAGVSGQGGGVFPFWIRPGLHVGYVVTSSSVAIAPWAPMTSTLEFVGVGAGEWTEKVPVPKTGKVSVVGLSEHYVVEKIDGRGVHLYFSEWCITPSVGPLHMVYGVLVPHRRPFNGPFWLDPGLLRGARPGGVVSIRHGDRVVEYRVVFAGRYDISPLSSGEGSLLGAVGVTIAVPVPRGTVRDVVGLSGRIEIEGRRVYHELVVDRETGLILVEALIERSGGGAPGGGGALIPPRSSMFLRLLGEINMDLENVLPGYGERGYDYGALVHSGYVVHSAGVLVPGGNLLNSVIATNTIQVVGVYKNYALIYRSLFLGLQNPIARIYVDLEDLDTGETTVLSYQDVTSSQSVEVNKRHSQGLLLVPRGRFGSETLSVYGVSYGLLGSPSEAEIEGIGRVRVYAYASQEEGALIGALLYAETEEGGVLVGVQPDGLQGYTFSPMPVESLGVTKMLGGLEEKIVESRGNPGWEQVSPTTTTSGATGTSTGGAYSATSTTPITSSGGGGSTATGPAPAGWDGLLWGGLAAVLVVAVLAAFLALRKRSAPGVPPPPPPPPG